MYRYRGRFGYHYDDIGNRVTGGDPLQPGGTLPNKVRVDYDPDDINELNQYERLTEHPGLCDVQNGTEITACDGAAGDNFGCAVSATDSFALVGAFFRCSALCRIFLR